MPYCDIPVVTSSAPLLEWESMLDGRRLSCLLPVLRGWLRAANASVSLARQAIRVDELIVCRCLVGFQAFSAGQFYPSATQVLLVLLHR